MTREQFFEKWGFYPHHGWSDPREHSMTSHSPVITDLRPSYVLHQLARRAEMEKTKEERR